MQWMPDFDRSKLKTYGLAAALVLLVGLLVLRDGQEGGSGRAAPLLPQSGVPEVRSPALTVDVSGAVRSPGVYRLARGSRVIDAIRRAGGAIPAGDPQAINRAALLVDGQQVVVPRRGPELAGTVGPGADPGSGPVSLGTATIEDLEAIEGIGPVTAGEIIEFRDSRGGISSIDDLDQISGIGPVTMESLRSALQP